jgi:hypothetical protein
MRVEERCESFSAKKRSISRNDERELCASAYHATRDLHGVTGTALRLLQYGLSAKSSDDGADFLGLMAHDDEQLGWFERLTSAYDMLDQRASPGAMQDFRQIGTHARPLASG